MMSIASLESTRIDRISTTDLQHKSDYGQYLTPVKIAEYMSDLLVSNLSLGNLNSLTILDPGAGSGILSCVLVDKLIKNKKTESIHLDTYEIDATIIPELEKNLHHLDSSLCQTKIIKRDFLKDSSESIQTNMNSLYDIIIMNPPYKKITATSSERKYLRAVGIETVNLYSGFVGIANKLLKKDGSLVAIIPRSFCNGLYYAPFRDLILSSSTIKHIHIFKSRKQAFIEESVLQENVIILIQKTDRKPELVTVSYSNDRQFNDYKEISFPYSTIVDQGTKHHFITIPDENNLDAPKFMIKSSLSELGLSISTGPIVDFRMKDNLRYEPENGTIPLLYPQNLNTHACVWPLFNKKPTSIKLTSDEIQKLAFPAGFYLLIKRFSSKEEKRRVWVTLLSPNEFESEYFTLENHINFIHAERTGLPEIMALGLFVYLCSEYFDIEFRSISGSTQVNSTDLRNMPFPTKKQLEELGERYLERGNKVVFDDLLFEVLYKNE